MIEDLFMSVSSYTPKFIHQNKPPKKEEEEGESIYTNKPTRNEYWVNYNAFLHQTQLFWP